MRTKTETVNGVQVAIVQISEGEVVTHSPARGGGKREVRIGQAFEVRADDEQGQVLGVVERRMLTRERKIPGRRYVEARWESPGWVTYGPNSLGSKAMECFTKREGISALTMNYTKN